MNKLRNNQIKAIDNFENHYYNEKQSRGILSMCCGSGKTRTFYEIMKNCINKHDEKFFIYTTSRILLVKGIVQEIIEWMYKENLSIDILIKVSDFKISDIKTEIIIKNDKDKNFDKCKFNKFFNFIKDNNIKLLENDNIVDVIKSRYILDNKKILIITTYESIIKIINAIANYNNEEKINKKIIPDLLTCDESHNLVSSDNDLKTAKKILDEDQDISFNPNKFLFMTATPLKIIKRNKIDDYLNNDIIYSMTNEKLYGKVFYEYTFYEGIKDKYILDFDIIYLSDIDNTDDNLTKEAFENLKFYDDKNKQQQVYFDIVAQYLLETIKIYNLKHSLVYLSNQAKARSLYEILNKHIQNKKLNNKVGYIVSGQSISEKNLNKNNFESYDGTSKILISVDIFNEGIDIPICDSILFAEDRNSETVIAQNIGRSLRIYNNDNNNFIKNKSYIILPTKIYKNDDSLDESAFSSRFKKVREVCDILKEPPEDNNPHYFTRKTKGDTKKFKNDFDDENINESSGLVDNIIIVNDNLESNNNIYDLSDLSDELSDISNKIFNSFEIRSSNDNLSNIKLDKLKNIVQCAKINNLFELSNFIKENSIIIDKPHIYYKNDWLCYGDFLFNKIYTYNEAVEIIKSLNLNNINSPKEWQNYYNNIIELAFKNECDDSEINILNKIMYIPYDPKTYYIEEWKLNDNNLVNTGWNNFLGKELDNTTGIEISTIKSSCSINASNNLKNLINQDKDKVKNLIKNDWQNFNDIKTDLSSLKNFIDNMFSIDSKIELRFILTNTYSLQSQILNIRTNDQLFDLSPPITINFNYSCKYDKNIYHINKLKKQKINRTEEILIQNKNLQKIIDDLYFELKKYIKDNNNLNF
jgi:superfamily II DNA or RNA helicase